MKKFLVQYLAPASIIDDWKRTDPETRQAAEATMRAAWDAWMGEHAHALSGTEAAGKTKRVTASGVTEPRNNLMLYTFVEAESHEVAARMFETHPHLQIPQSSIEITDVRSMGPPQA